MGFARHFRRLMQKNESTVDRKSRRKAVIEPLEPRLLLSADSIVGGITASLAGGLTDVSSEIDDLIKEDPLFQNLVPGIVETLTVGDNVYQVSPTLEEALDIGVDVYASDNPAGFTGTWQEKFEAIDNMSNEFYSDYYKPMEWKAEKALRTMDLDGDSNVTLEEAFNVMVIGQLQDHLSKAVDNLNGDTVTDEIDLAMQVDKFLNGTILFDNPNLHAPNFLDDYLSLTVDSASWSFKNDTLTWTMDNFSLSLIERNTFDLGYEGENLGIAIDPGTPPNANNDPYSLPVVRTMEFGSFSFGVKNVSGGVAAEDFFFAAPDRTDNPDDGVRIGVSVGEPGSPYATGLVGVDVNIGFLGAEIISADGTGIVLDMDVMGGAVDPSHAGALGFADSQLGALTTGTIEAENTVDLTKLKDTPIEFTFKLGTDVDGVEHEVTLEQGTYADTAAVVSALNTALASAGFNSIFTTSDSDSDDKIEFNVVDDLNPAPLGFEAETGSVVTISGNPSDLVGKTAAELKDGPHATFLLVVTNGTTGVTEVRKVAVSIEVFSDNNGTVYDTTDDKTTLANVRYALETAANAAFAGTVITFTAGTDGANVTLSSTGNRLEITRQFTVDTLEQITLAELTADSQVFDVAADTDAVFQVDLTLKALPGLEDSNSNPYLPEGTIKVDVQPFTTDIKRVVIDTDPVEGTPIVSAGYQLTDADNKPLIDGESNLQTMLDFNVITVSDILSIFTQIGNWFDRVSASDLLLGFDIPFAETTLGSLLNFKDLISDTFLIDDKDDGPTKSGTDEDIEKLLGWYGDEGKEQLRAVFGNAQQLEAKLNALLGPDVDATVFTDGVGRQNLTYNLSVAGVTLDVDPQTAGDQALTVPLDFEMDLGALANFETSGKLAIEATGDIGFDLGIILGNAVNALDDDTEIATLNSDNGVTLNTNLAITSLGVIDPLVGRISADATFVVTIFDGTDATDYTVTLTKAATETNTTIAHLLTDLNEALETARHTDGTEVDISGQLAFTSEPIQGDTKTARIVLQALDSGIERFQVVTAINNTAYTELGFQTQSASTVSLIAPLPVPSAAPGKDIVLDIFVSRGATTTTVAAVTLAATATADNVSLQSLVDDLNALLLSEDYIGLGLVVSQSGGRLVFSAVDSDITALRIQDAYEKDDLKLLGLDLAAANAPLEAAGVDLNDDLTWYDVRHALVAGVQLRGGSTPLDPFGRLAVDLNFTINGYTVNVAKGLTADNTSIDDLIRTLNTAIEDNTYLKGEIAAVNDGGRIALRAIASSVTRITVADLSDAESAAIGIANGSTLEGLTVRSTNNAPVSYGISAQKANFTVTINGTEYSATLLRDNTILNRSLYDLAADLNSAINAAVGGANLNPLIVTVQSGQIVIGIKTSPTGSSLIGDPVAHNGQYVVAPITITSFSISSNDASFRDELKLVSSITSTDTDFVRGADTADFVIHFSDGQMARISLDTLDTDKDQKVDGTLGALIAAIHAQVAAQTELTSGSDPTDGFEIKVAPNGTSLLLIDRTGGSETTFRVTTVNGSPAAAQLGIQASDVSSVNVAELAAGETAADGVIDGGRIATIDLIDRVYLENVSASAELTVKTLGVASAEASFGFAGIKLESLADQTLFSATADLPLFDAQTSLKTLFDALSAETKTDLENLIGDPTLTLDGDFSLNVSILPGFNVADFIEPTTPTIKFKTDAVVIDLDTINAALPAGQRFPDLGIAIEANGFGDLLKFEDIGFDNVLDAVEAIAAFLNQFEAFSFLGDEIPVLGVSINDLLDIADQFQQAVDDFRESPAGGIQKLAQKIREAFGLPEFADNAEALTFLNNFGLGLTAADLPAGYQLIQFALVGGNILKLDLRLPVGFSKGMNVDLDLGKVFGEDLGPIDIQGGAGIAASGYLDARLSFGINLDDPEKLLIYDDNTGVYGGLTAGGTNLQFNAAIGPLGAFIKDGRVDVALDFNVTGNDGDGNPESLSAFLSNLQASVKGSAEAVLPVFFPTDSQYLGDIEFSAGLALTGENLGMTEMSLDVPDFSGIDLSSIDPFGSIPLMLDTLDFFLQGLQDILDGEVFGIQLPLIGNQLQGGADFIEDLRKEVLTPIRQYAEQAPELGQEIFQKLLYSILGPGSEGVSLTGLGDLSEFLGLTNDFNGLGFLSDFNNDGSVTFEDVPVLDDGTGALWKFQLSGEAPISIDLGFDLGIPALALESDAALDIKLTWALALGLGINTVDGAYILIGGHDDGTVFGDKELQLSLAVDVRNSSSITGSLGFLQLVIEELVTTETIDVDPQGDLEHDDRGTYIQADFWVDLYNTSDADDTKLSFSELGSIGADVGLEADAEVNLGITGRFNPELLPATVSALLPEINGRFVLDWETGNILSSEFDFGDSLKFVGFRDVEVDMGSFVNDLIKPFVEKIAEVTGPLQPIIDVVIAPIPVISDLAGQPISLLDIAGMTGYVDPGMIYAVADIISLVNKIGNTAYGSFYLPLGDFVLLDSEATENSGNYLTGDDLLKSGYNLASDERFDPDNLATFLGDTIGALGDFDSLMDSGTGSSSTSSLVSGLKSGSEGGAGFAFPVFDDPSLLFGLLLGKDIPLITYDLAPFKMEFTYVQKFPVWDALFIRIGGSVGFSIDLAFGYDTKGVRDFADGGFSNPLDLIAGFYISDTNQPTGEGVDVPELVLKGELFAGAELNLGIASAGAEGVIGLVVNFDLYDPDSDGRVRINELVGNFLYEWNYGNKAAAPIAIFDVYGEMYAQLRAFVEALFFKIEFEITPPITLFEFKIPFEREPFLATERGDGSLLLNIGPNAGQRLNGDVRDIDETIYVKSNSATEVLVWGMGINESDAQKYKVDPTKGIFAYGGEGNDIIDLSGVTDNIAYTLDGGAGDDTIYGTAGGGSMKGGLGNDNLYGGAGTDLIYGGEGNDTIEGGAGNDVIFGDSGTVRVMDDSTRYRSFVGAKDGDDKILGGGDNDIIFGGGGMDWIEGGDGVDIVLGDGGNFDTDALGKLTRDANGRYNVNARGAGARDTIFGNAGDDILFGGAGDDLIDGGADNDDIEGGDGFDVIYGGSGADTIFGGNQADIIFGFRDPQGDEFGQAGDTSDNADDGVDTIYGEEGNDYIRGQGGNDIIYGGRGADIIFGDEGNDEIYGEAGGDIIFGGADNDIIDAGAGADIVFGDDGLVVYVNFDTTKDDFNFTGSRIRFLDDDQLIGDGHEGLIDGYEADTIATSMDLIVTKPLSSDGSDTIIGGDGNDIVFGGGGTLDELFGDYDPDLGFAGPRPSGQDILIGDGGRVELFGRRNARAAAVSDDLDGEDEITGNDGGDYIFGGGNEDKIYGFLAQAETTPLNGVSDNDVILGDNGEIFFDTTDAKNRVEQIRTTAVTGDSGMSDEIYGNYGNDVIFGGLNSSSDYIYGNDGSDILIGDNGEVIFDADSDLDTVDLIRSFTDNLGGIDFIYGNNGDDILIGGTAGDTMYGNDGEDIMLGDNARIELTGTEGRLLVQVAAMPAPTAIDLITTTDTVETTGGADIMSGNAGDDILFGGVAGDTMYGDAASPVNDKDGDDILVGDNGLLDFTYGSDSDRSTLDLIRSEPYAVDWSSETPTVDDSVILGGIDTISGNAGSDVVIGGVAGDVIYGDNDAAFAEGLDVGDILVGDNADIFLIGTAGQRFVLGTAVDRIVTTDDEEATGGADLVEGNAGADIIIGGVNNDGQDDLYGDAAIPVGSLDGNDIILGDNAELDWTFNDQDRTTLDLIATITYAVNGTTVLGSRDNIFGNAGDDIILGGSGGDLIIGDNDESSNLKTPGAADTLEIYAGADILIGDQGRLVYENGLIALIETTDLLETDGGIDYIEGNDYGDIILGGVWGDILIGESQYGNAADQQGKDYVGTPGADIIIGDEGRLRYNVGTDERLVDDDATGKVDENYAFGDGDPETLDLIQTFKTGNTSGSPVGALGGADWIFGNEGADIVMGGTDGDSIYGDFYAALTLNDNWGFDDLDADITPARAPVPGEDILIGDGGQITYHDEMVTMIRSIEPGHGGSDMIQGNDLSDIIMGGFDGDLLYGEADPGNLGLIIGRAGDDVILGDNGRMDWILVSDDILGRQDVIDYLDDNGSKTVALDDDPLTLDRITTTDQTLGGNDVIYGNGNSSEHAGDLIFGGTGSDTIYGDGDTSDAGPGADGPDGKDLAFGDHGKVYPTLPSVNLFFVNNNFFSIHTNDTDLGNGDVIFGNANDDILIGGQGDDIVFGGTGDDDLIGGHNISGSQDPSDGENAHDDMDGMDAASILAIAPEVLAHLNPADVNEINDILDGGAGDDVIAGDNAIIIRQPNFMVDGFLSPRFRMVGDGGQGYTLISQSVGGLADIDVGFEANVTDAWQPHQDMTLVRTITLLDHSEQIEDAAVDSPTAPRSFGNDIIAGGTEDDEIFGQLGDDIIQGDGEIEVTVFKEDTNFDPYNPAQDADPSFDLRNFIIQVDLDTDNDTLATLRFNVFEQLADGDDYIEGNGGNDRIYGNLGQDDIIGGSSTLFGLGDTDAGFQGVNNGVDLRPDGADLIYGGAGNVDLLARNATVANSDTLVPVDERHATDADTILGDNGDIYRVVIDSGTGGIVYGRFNYDMDATVADGFVDDGYGTDDLTIRPRLVNFADYGYFYVDHDGDPGTREVLRFTPDARGEGDLIYGESGDDVIHGMVGNDAIFGGSEHDDLYGEIGSDYLLGGTGIDGILGDDGLILTSRNDLNPEPLYGIEALNPQQVFLKKNDEVDTQALNAVITTPGNIQIAIINIENELAKAVELFAFRTDDMDAGVIGKFGDSMRWNDIIFGGWDSDFIHGGDGDDAISGAEALPAYYSAEDFGFTDLNTFLQDMQDTPPNDIPDLADNPFWFDFAPYNPGDILRYEGKTIEDGTGQNPKTRQEFAWYDEFNPRKRIVFDFDNVTVLETIDDFTGTPIDFILNFDAFEGPLGPTFEGEDRLPTDGADRIFGDLGNDWLVGGAGRDHMYGGRGDDLINMDDNHESGAREFNAQPKQTVGDSLENTLSDEFQAYADIVYSGAGRDVMILNTGADRAIDWVGEYNNYIVPFSPFGAFHISRTLQPQMPEFLQALSVSDGIDNRVDPAKLNNVVDAQLYVDQKMLDVRTDDPDPLRNGEPYGELGMVRQTDYDWQAQTGAPNDPQPGNLQGKREIMRRELFTDGDQMSLFSPDMGTWLMVNGTYQAAPEVLGEDAVSIYDLDLLQPPYMEILSSVSVNKATGGLNANAYIIFDYMDWNNFKFAGIDTGLDKIRIGHYNGTSWIVDTQVNMKLLENTFYDLTLVMYGTVATIWVDQAVSASFDFGDALNDGYIGLGTNNAKATFDDFQIQKLPPTITFEYSAAEKPFVYSVGEWDLSGGQYTGTPAVGTDRAIATQYLDVSPYSRLEMETAIRTSTLGGLIFDYYNADDFKFAALKADSNQIVIGHRTSKGWFIDAEAAYTVDPGQSYTLGVGMFGSNVSVTVNGNAVTGFVFNSLLNDGYYGLLSKDGSSIFDNFKIRGDDPAYQMTLPPIVSIADMTVGEEDGTAYVTVELSKPADETVSVYYTTENGTAFAGDDYTATTGTLTFAPGETSMTIAVQITDDPDNEGDETLSVRLFDPTGLTLGKDTAVVTILDDDAPPVISVLDAQVSEGDSGNTTVSVEFTLSKASDDTVTVNYETADETAASGTDYSTQSGPVTFDPGQTSVWVDFTVYGDEDQEANETFAINLTDASTNADIGDGQGLVTILNDDDIPTVTVTASDADASEDGQDTGEFIVIRDFIDGPLAVVLNLGGTAILNQDYTITASDGAVWDGINTLTFDDGVASATLTVTPIDDDVAEGDENVVFTLVDASAYSSGSANSAEVTITDNDTALPSLWMDNVTVVEGDKFNNRVTFTINLSEASADSVSVTVKTANGTALWGEDYTAFQTTLTFNPGETSKSFVVRIIGDTAYEPTERFFFELSDAANAVIAGEGKAEVTIVDDDTANLLAAETAKGPHKDVALLTEDQLDLIVAEAIARWEAELGTEIELGMDNFQIVDFKGYGRGILGETTPDMIYIDADAAGWGWYVDPTPADDSEFEVVDSGEEENRMDLLTVVMHEIGHVLGYDDLAADADELMSATLDAGERLVPDGDSLVIMDPLPDSDPEDAMPAHRAMQKNPWLREFLMTRAGGERNPFEPLDDFSIEIAEEEGEDA